MQPQNNKQAYLYYLNGMNTDLPEPRTVEEVLLYNLCVNSSSSGGGGDLTHIGWVWAEGDNIEGKDVTNQITYRPTFINLYTQNDIRPLTLVATDQSSGFATHYLYYLKKMEWDAFSYAFDLYFHCSDGSGSTIRLHYTYASDSDAEPQSITVHYS